MLLTNEILFIPQMEKLNNSLIGKIKRFIKNESSKYEKLKMMVNVKFSLYISSLFTQ